MLAYRRAAHADNTHSTYATAGNRYERFGATFALGALYPATDTLLCRFATYLATEKLAFGTIKIYLFGIRSIQLDKGMEFRSMRERYELHQTLQGIRRTIGTTRHPKMPITIPLLRKFATIVERKRADPKQKIRWGAIWAAILVGFFGMLRKDNLTAGKKTAFNDRQGLTRRDVQFKTAKHSNKTVAWLRIRYSKTNQTGGEPLVIPVAAQTDSLCPVTALRVHMAETTSSLDDNLFLMKGSGERGCKPKALTHSQLVQGIKELAKDAGLDPKTFAGHSLRRGGATLAFQLGVDTHYIQQHGGWKSDAVYLYHELSWADRLRLPTLMAKAANASFMRI